MKPFAIISESEDVVNIIAAEILNYIVNNTNLLPTNQRGWQFIDSKDLLNSCPTLKNFFVTKKLLVKNSAVTLCYDDTDLPIHVDEPPVVAKINFPVLNNSLWENIWYDIPIEHIKSCPVVKNQFGKDVYNLTEYKNSKILDSISNFVQPIVFNSTIPHSVRRINDNAPCPRITASFTFHNEPISWLK